MKKTAPKQENIDLVKLSKRIKELRLKSGARNAETFAYDNEIGRAQYARYERGEDLRYSSLLRVIKALGITVSEFFSEGFDD